MGLEIIKDGVVIHQDNKPSLDDVISQQEQIINDLKNQIKQQQIINDLLPKGHPKNK
jgi:hypothetical protein